MPHRRPLLRFPLKRRTNWRIYSIEQEPRQIARIATAVLVISSLMFVGVTTASAEGCVVEKSETVVEKGELPDTVLDGFAETEYASWPIVERAKVESKDHGSIYEIEVQTNDMRRGLFFNSDGTLLDIEVESAE